MKSSGIFKVDAIVAALSVLWPTMALADLSAVPYDNFDDGNYDGWTVGDHVSSFPIGGLVVRPSPDGYAVAGEGWPSGHGIWHPLNTANSTELSFEMRTTSGGSIDCSLIVWNEFEYPMGQYYQGLSYQRMALFALRDEDGVEHVFNCASGLSGWHDFKWARDAEGWWSLR